jgi:purine-binding chemotaxis protein CheW
MAQTSRQLDQEARTLYEKEGKYLTFTLAQEDHGLEILKVREIIGMMAITAIPQTPPYIKGVINLRGRVIPVVDLRLKFGLPPLKYGERTCIIVVDVSYGQTVMQVGVVVDAVSEVLNVTGSDIEPPPSFGFSISNNYILGIAKSRGGIKILLDIDRVLASEEMAEIEALSA